MGDGAEVGSEFERGGGIKPSIEGCNEETGRRHAHDRATALAVVARRTVAQKTHVLQR